MKMKTLVSLLAIMTVALTQHITPYIGGNQFSNYYTNPNLINQFLTQLNPVENPACKIIPGVGQPILAIKQMLQIIDTQLDVSNRDSNAKIIFFKEKKNSTTFQTNYKLVIQVKTFSSNNYVAVEGLYKQIGFPTFEVLTYYFDSNIDNIRSILNEYTVDPNNFVGCGDVKSIYSQANPVLPKPTVQVNGQQSNPSQTPYAQGNQLINSAPHAQSAKNKDVDPALIAQIIQLLRKN